MKAHIWLAFDCCDDELQLVEDWATVGGCFLDEREEPLYPGVSHGETSEQFLLLGLKYQFHVMVRVIE